MDDLAEIIDDLVGVFCDPEGRTRCSKGKRVEVLVGHVSVLRHRRRDSQGIGPIGKAQGSGSDACTAKRSMELILKPRVAETELINRASAQRLGVRESHHLGPARVLTAKARQERVRNVLVVLIEEVVAGEKSDTGVVVDASAGFIVRKVYRSIPRGEVSVSVHRRIRRRYVWQQIRGRHSNHAGRNLCAGKDTGCCVTTGKIVGLSLGDGVAEVG